MNQEWIASCIETLQNFVERSTRLSPEKLELVLLEEIDFKYQIGLLLHFKIEMEQDIQAGRVRATDSSLVFTNTAKYEAAIKSEVDAVLSRRETLTEAQSLVLGANYGALRKDTVIYSHRRCICLTKDCTKCQGRGKVDCSWCRGSGDSSCSSCGGSGQVMKQRSHYDYYTKQTRYENYYQSCNLCHGSGNVSCIHCFGSGDKKCSPCDGSGKMSEITKLHSVAVPQYQLIYLHHDVPQFIKDGLYKAGLPDLGKFGRVSLESSKIDDVARRIQFIFNAELPFARFESPIPQVRREVSEQKIKWIVYGVKPQILDAGHVIELMLKSHLDQLVHQTIRKNLLNPFVAVLTRPAIKI